MQSMAVKHNIGRWNLKRYAKGALFKAGFAKGALFKAGFAVFWAQKEVVEPTTWVLNRLDNDETCL